MFAGAAKEEDAAARDAEEGKPADSGAREPIYVYIYTCVYIYIHI